MMSQVDFCLNLDMDAAIILANMQFDNKDFKQEDEKEEYITLDPINRINEINY